MTTARFTYGSAVADRAHAASPAAFHAYCTAWRTAHNRALARGDDEDAAAAAADDFADYTYALAAR